MLDVHATYMSAVVTNRGRIGFVECGAGERTPMIFLHGVGSDKSVWQPQLDHFGISRQAVAFDYPGYGESDFIDGATRDDYAASILAAMDALAIDRAHVCGLSLGGVVAIAMHAMAAHRCASLIIADSFAAHPEGRAIFDRSVAASHNGMRALAEARVGALLASNDNAIRKDVIDTMARIDPAAYRIGAEAVWLAEQTERARAIDLPTLMLCGVLDPVTPPALSEDLAQLISGSRLEIIGGASHLANLDKPDAFNRAVDDFLSEVERQV
jgi:3-oxoadipate enol-lactonase